MLLNLNKTEYSAGTGYHVEAQTFGQFKEHLSQLTSIPIEQLIVKFGHPPVVLDYPDVLPLANIPIYDGAEVVVVRRNPAPQPSTPSAAIATDTPFIMPPTMDHKYTYADNHVNNKSPDPLKYTEVLEALFREEEAKKHPTSNNDSELYGSRAENATQLEIKEKHVSVDFEGGYLVKRTVPSDDSCLFTSIASCYGEPGITAHKLRVVVCDVIRGNPNEYNAAVLEQSVDEYCKWISKTNSWGGGIEMAAISEALQIEICSVDTRTRRTLQFGQGRYPHRVILLYSGSHYDYVAFAANPENPRTFDQTMFNARMPNAGALLRGVAMLAAKL
ncbi:ubiquitin-specific protease otu1 [Coemansia sp. RSA 988]|nr:ubiquitin-specific protease otu1 [Coemansia sp. RSA 988]